MKLCTSYTILFMVLTTFNYNVDGLAVMSVDIGSEWMKVAIVSPGVPMEIALNKESQRKTPVAVSFRDGERSLGDPAVNTAVRFPDKAYMYLLDLMGKRVDNPLVKLFQQRFPYYTIEPTEDRSTVLFKHPEGESFTPEELMAMVLKQAQQIAQNAAGQPIKDVVITVPPYFNQVERHALSVAAQLSGLNLLQLINSNTATALNYGVFRRRDFNETPTNILFYDMGAGSTVATVVSYQLVKSKDTGEVNPQLAVKGVGFDRTLGGLEMQLRLRDHLAQAFNSDKKVKSDVRKNPRSMAKLLKEAGRVKKVLSANTEHIAQVESLMDDIDFKAPITRAEFETLCADLFERVTHPIEVALNSAGLAKDHIDQVILAGSGARVPKVQQILLDYIEKQELGKSINTDESAALGAVYQAAHLSKGFKVKTFLIKDAAIYPIQVNFQREFENSDKTTGIKNVRRTLFTRNNAIPSKKALTFNRLDKDFDFYVSYGDLDFLNEFELESLGSLNLTKVSVTGVSDALGKHSGGKSEFKGVKAYFKIDENGSFHFEDVEAVFEEPAISIEETTSKLQSTLSKLGDTFNRLFSSGEAEVEKDSASSPDEASKTEKPKSEEDDKKSEQQTANETEKAKSENETSTPAPEKDSKSAKKEPKLILTKEPLTAEKTVSEIENLSENRIDELMQRLKAFDDRDKAKLARDKAKNNLESFIVETKHLMYTEEMEQIATEKEKETINAALSETGDWLEYESDEATTDVFKSKLSGLRKVTKELFERVKEHQERPEAIKALVDMLNISEVFHRGAKDMSEEDQIFTEVELKTLENLIADTKKWMNEMSKEQDALQLNVQPKLTVKLLAEKFANLDREVKYLLNKARFAKPLKKKKIVEETQTANETNQTIASESDADKISTAEPDVKPLELANGSEVTTEETDTKTNAEKSPTTESDAKPLELADGSEVTIEETDIKTSTTPVTEVPKPDEVKDEPHSEL